VAVFPSHLLLVLLLMLEAVLRSCCKHDHSFSYSCPPYVVHVAYSLRADTEMKVAIFIL
jgi:hypothetical protein